MKNLMLIVGVAALAGCHFDPGTYPVTDYDTGTVVKTEGAMAQKKEKKAKIAVVATPGKYKDYTLVSDTLASTLNARLSQFAFFEIVDRDNLGVAMSENMLTADDPTSVGLDAVQADFILIAKILTLTQSTSSMGTSAEATFDFTWMSPRTKKVLMKKSIKASASLIQNAAEVGNKLAKSAEDAANQFCMAVSAKYAPPARTLETRGGGEVAKISIGSNYGLSEGMTVVFFRYVDNSDVVEGATRDESPIGNAVVKLAEEKSAWVKVDKFPDVKAARGMYVKIPEQKDSLMGNLTGNLVR